MYKEILKLKRRWTKCHNKKCGNHKECERANHYIDTIWNPLFKEIKTMEEKSKHDSIKFLQGFRHDVRRCKFCKKHEK